MPEVILNGPHGRIECRYHSGQSPDSPIALILHPEPNQGGSMNNKVTCNNVFKIKDEKVISYEPKGRCYTDTFLQPE